MLRGPQYPLLRLTAAADGDAATRYDFNDGPTWTADGINLGAPGLLGDPGAVNPSYDYRTIGFKSNTTAPEGVVLARYQELARALLRDDNFLLYKHSATAAPIWFELVRSSPASLAFDRIFRNRTANTWPLELQLKAEPFGLGERITHFFTISPDPTDDNGLMIELPPILGDAPAPLDVELFLTSGLVVSPAPEAEMPIIAASPVPDDWQEGFARYAEPSIPFGSADTTTVSDGQAVGGTAKQSTFSGSDRKIYTLADLPEMGRWTYWARVRMSNTNTTAVIIGGGKALKKAKTTKVTGDSYRWIKLGEYVFPKHNMPATYIPGADAIPNDYENDELVTLKATRTSGAGNLLTDLLVGLPSQLLGTPAGGTVLVAGDVAPLTNVARIDSKRGRVTFVLNTERYPAGGHSMPLSGGFPRVHPGWRNVFHLLRHTSPIIEMSGKVSYQPLHLYLAPQA